MLSFLDGRPEVYVQRMNLEELTSRLSIHVKSGLAQRMGISRQALASKMEGKTPFTLNEAKIISELLRLTPNEVVSIFF